MADEPNVKALFNATIANSMFNGILDLGNSGLTDISEVIIPEYTAKTATLSTQEVEAFASRYTSLDSFSASEDGSDISYLRVLKFLNGKFGSHVFPIDTKGNKSRYKNFIITTCGGAMVEKAQIIKTNNTLQINAFDSQVEVLNIQGVLKSTLQDPWDMGMIILWDDLLRLTKQVQMNLITEFGYQSNIYWGYPLNFSWQKSSNMQYLVSFSMQFIVVKRSSLMKNDNQLSMAFDFDRQIKHIPFIN